MELNGKQKRHLRALAHDLSPVAQVGREGLTDAVGRKIDVELENHELIKVKVGDGCLEDTKDVAAGLAASCKAAVAQVIGRTIVLYRRRKKDPRIVLPKPSAA
jgi:RNA-binding protein